jgi:membrane protein DedA with SNARE-associated domain
METLLHWVQLHGYLGLFVLLFFGIFGLWIPDETILIFAGSLVFHGDLRMAPTLLAAFSGAACGITLSYFVGRGAGYPLIHRYGRYVHVTPARLERVERWFERIGRWALLVGYFIPGVRHMTAIIAGTSKLPYHIFAVFAYVGGAFWTATFIILGFYLGEQWKHVAPHIARLILLGSIVLGVALVLYLLLRRWRAAR